MTYIDTTPDQEAVNRLGDATRQLFVENRAIGEELHIHIQEAELLKTQKMALEEEKKKLVRDIDLNEENLQEYAKQAQAQKKTVLFAIYFKLF